MANWVFRDYVSSAGTNQIAKWARKVLSVQEQVELETLLDLLSKQKQWSERDFKTLSGKHLSGISEIRFKSAQGTPIRVLGMKGPGANEYILLVGCTHKGKVYDPAEALDTAVVRKNSLTNGTGGSHCEHEED